MDAIVDWQTAWPHLVDSLQAANAHFPLSYTTSAPFAVALQMLLVVTFACWLASVLTRNYSYVDRVWSLAPIAYVGYFAYRAYLDDALQWNARLVLMTMLTTMWGLRLSYNFYRKGGYNLKEEDYRWGILREKMHPLAYQLFNIVFIAGYQNVLVFSFTVPVYAAYVYRAKPLNALDVVAAVLLLLLLLMETVADQQQWVFYQKKYALLAAKKPLTGDYAAGFNRSGLFRFSRHPNYFAEVSIWWAFYLFSVASSDVLVNPTVIGAVALTMLFVPSAIFTESISIGKYPEYKKYQKTVSRIIPWFPASSQHAD